MNPETSLRSDLARQIKKIRRADLVVGIPCFNNEETIGHVIETVSQGLYDHYRDMKAVLLISDGGSTDDTRECAVQASVRLGQQKLVAIYRGLAGKGSALRSVFEAADLLSASACMVVDSDLRSITGEWVHHLLAPVLDHHYDFVAPIYTRYKYDGTITNNIAYNLTRALYGRRVRQPIGGDFAFSLDCARSFSSKAVWDSDIARFGIDIWMTTTALVEGYSVCQSRLGVKAHDSKDPAAHLAPMFRQVLFTLFLLMEQNEMYWKIVTGSEPTEVFGLDAEPDPPPVAINHGALCESFRNGLRQFGVLWEHLFPPEIYADIREAAASPDESMQLKITTWVQILYRLAATFHHWESHRFKLLEIATPLYNARVAAFVNETRDLTSRQAEEVVEAQAKTFEEEKPELLRLWEDRQQISRGLPDSGPL
ncbi:MAG: glycosyltransferase family 2 protein [candidate division Zixibacteria bacterium]|nr:glycosyltransferase family 2 protein [candidate division Zixibacteria bacterium]